MENKKVFNSAEQSNSEKYSSRKEAKTTLKRENATYLYR